MTDFTISCRQDPDAPDGADSIVIYNIRVGGDDAYRTWLCRRPGEIRSSRFETLAAGFRPFEINQASLAGLRRINIREAFAGPRIGEMRGLRLYFDGPNQVVDLHDPATPVRRLARRVVRGRPQRFIYRQAVDRGTIGGVEAPPSIHGGWLTRIVKGIDQSRLEKETLVWRGRLDNPDLDLRPFIAAAVVMHGDQGYGHGPRGYRGRRR